MLRELLRQSEPSAATVDRSEHSPLPLSRSTATPRPAHSLGAVAVIHDLTAEENLPAKARLVDRPPLDRPGREHVGTKNSNPLVAIKTFPQLA